jgi:hypothetical protein
MFMPIDILDLYITYIGNILITQIFVDNRISKEEKILQFIKENEGCTKTKVMVFMENKKYASPLTTYKTIQNLINEGKIISRPDKTNTQKHHLFINHKNRFNQIKKEISQIESYIEQTNGYLRELFDDNLKHIADLEKSDEDKEIDFNHQTDFYRQLETIYRQEATRMLEDFFHIVATSNLPVKDIQLFHRKIIELKSRLAYYTWSITTQKSIYRSQIASMKNYIRIAESQKAIEQYIKEKDIKNKFTEPLTSKVENFIDFLNLS